MNFLYISMRLIFQCGFYFFPDNSNHTPPPPYSSVPFASPPPRYVSVIGLNESQQNSAKSKNSRATSKSKTKVAPKIAPVSLSNSSVVVEDQDGDAGLPTYDEALNREERENSNPSGGSGSSGGTNVLRVSMV